MKKNEPIIAVEGLCKSFSGKRVVNALTMTVCKGEVFGFLGPNGSGKTTTIRMLCGLLTPDSGYGKCLGYDIINESKKIKQHVGYMTQRFSFYSDLSIEENLNFIARVYGLNNRKEQVEAALKNLGLEHRKEQLTGELSGGWKQRVALAACLLHKPNLLLLDEPTAGVDPLARRDFWDKIHSLSEEGVTTLVSTHYMDEAERCTRLAYLAYGELLVTGTVSEVIASTKLKTWQINGEEIMTILQAIKKFPSIILAALFGNQIHVSGYNQERIELDLNMLAKKHVMKWQEIQPTLEDAFISLVKKNQGEQ